ncbi:MAG TPA: hypothetical protein VGH54_05590 [Mycobacterium sp.]|jgi:hypothetical protein|uniref:hypothetical protein n=1 Tax=Mycobacterium sp. TaxID=1785 RepID=UPI002F3E5D64
MTADYATWRRDRLRELDAMQPKIDELPDMIGQQVRQIANWRRKLVESSAEYAIAADYWARQITQLAAELARIVVTPASDGETP